jgi:hypothetical protein
MIGGIPPGSPISGGAPPIAPALDDPMAGATMPAAAPATSIRKKV